MNKEHSLNGKETLDDKNIIKISNSVLQRLTSGAVQEEAHTDDDWIIKLDNIDRDHSKTTGLCRSEAEKLINNINMYVHTKSDRNCPVDTLRVSDCLKQNKGNTLTCDIEVENFKQCIDKSLQEAVYKSIKEVRKSKKESYTEKFEHKYSF